MRKKLIVRAVVIALLIVMLSALAAYTISSFTVDDDPLEGTWVNEDYGFEYGMKFKNGTSTISVGQDEYSPLEYRILSVEEEGSSLVVKVYIKADSNEYTDVYTVKEGNILEYDGIEYIKQ